MHPKYMLQYSIIAPVDKNVKVAASLLLDGLVSRLMVPFFLISHSIKFSKSSKISGVILRNLVNSSSSTIRNCLGYYKRQVHYDGLTKVSLKKFFVFSNLYLPVLAPTFCLPALAPYLYLSALALYLYLPTPASNLYLPALAPTFYLPALVSPKPGLAYTNIVALICIYWPWLTIFITVL